GLVACRFPDDSGARYRCDGDGACPAGLSCVDDVCVAERSACAVALTAGERHSCALRSDGTAWCWGRNRSGELGDGTTEDRTAPVQVAAGATRFSAIAAGIDHTCAVAQDGTVWCWGSNASGQRGGTPDGAGLAQLTGLDHATAIAAGAAHSCARLGGGAVRGRGAHGPGPPRRGHTTPSPAPPPGRARDRAESAARGGTPRGTR